MSDDLEDTYELHVGREKAETTCGPASSRDVYSIVEACLVAVDACFMV
jgi:hypothetical protein